jgi:hypothetical protein
VPRAPGTRAVDHGRAELAARLHARRGEIEQAALARALGVKEPPEAISPEYLEGLRGAVAAAVDYGIASARGEDTRLEAPPALIAQARLAARWGIGLDTVLRRYLAGFTLMSEFVLQEAEADPSLAGAAVNRALRDQAADFDRLLAAVSREYAGAREGRARARGQRLAERVEKLLTGEPVDVSELPYDIDMSHLAAVASGAPAPLALRELAGALGGRLLEVDRGEGVVWGWLGRRDPVEPSEAQSSLASIELPGVRIATGEPGTGIEGWRRSHRQARAAWQVALRGRLDRARYADVALPAAILQDDLLAASLRDLYILPLRSGRYSERTLLETLRAYFAADRNATSAAAALGISRQTVFNRLRSSEALLDRKLEDCAADLDVALRFADLCLD